MNVLSSEKEKVRISIAFQNKNYRMFKRKRGMSI